MPLFGRHGREFRKAVARGQWERTPEGILFPRQHALLHGHVTVDSRHGRQRFPNLLMFNASADSSVLAYVLGMLTAGGTTTALDGLYVALYGADITPTSGWLSPYIADPSTGVSDYTLAFDMLELGDAPEGYDEATRPAWTWVDQGGGVIDNSASPAAFTMRSASTIDVYGIALVRGDIKRRGVPVLGAGDGDGAYSAIDLTMCWFPEIITNSTLRVPTGATATGTGGLEERYGFGSRISIDTGIHPGDPNQYPVAAYSGGGSPDWYDPSGDDYYDSGLGYWVDPSGDSFVDNQVSIDRDLFAAARFAGAPLSFSDMDPLNVTWAIQLSST